MTKIATGLQQLRRGISDDSRQDLWWSVGRSAIVQLIPFIAVSDRIPDGAIVREVKIQADPATERFKSGIQIYLSIVETDNPSDDQIRQAERVIKWSDFADTFVWDSYGYHIHESWECYKTIHGANQRFAVAMISGDPLGMDCRVSVRYQI